MKTFLLPAVLFVLTASTTMAQTPAPTPPSRIPLWICNTPGGTYEVALRSMVSVSICDYIVDGAVHVSEVNIDTTGNMAVRFYFLEPVTPNAPDGVGQSTIDKAKDIAQQLQDRSGQDAWAKVIKNYPTTTHAHTIEYRIDNKDDLMKIFSSAENAFRMAAPATLSVGAPSELTPNSNPTNN